jgi:hypothetical protein
MMFFTRAWVETGVPALRQRWSTHRAAVMRVAVGVMAVLAVLKLGDEFRRLLWESGRVGAIDLRNYQEVVRLWFAGEPVYPECTHAVLPPASYLILWPFTGWLDFSSARWLWASTALGVLGTLSWLLLRESCAENRLERMFVVLLLLSMNATGITVGNGQLPLHALLATVAALLLVSQQPARWGAHVLAGALLVLALVKPTVSVPFLWMGLFTAAHGMWLGVFVVAGYVGLTLAAAAFQDASVVELFRGWLVRGSELASSAGFGNVNAWMGEMGLTGWMLPVSALMWLALGWWVFRHRRTDRWILLGVSALVARFWAYHRAYDDVLVVFPMVALFRIAKRGPAADGSDVTAGVVLAATILVMLMPARLGFDTSPFVGLYNATHTLVWLSMLVFLLECARRRQSAART